MTTYVSRWEGKDGPPPGEGSGRPHEGSVIVSHDGARPRLIVAHKDETWPTK